MITAGSGGQISFAAARAYLFLFRSMLPLPARGRRVPSAVAVAGCSTTADNALAQVRAGLPPLNFSIHSHVAHPGTSKHRFGSHAWRTRDSRCRVVSVFGAAHGPDLADHQQPDRAHLGQRVAAVGAGRSHRRVRRLVVRLPSSCPERLWLDLRRPDAAGAVAVVTRRDPRLPGVARAPRTTRHAWP